MAHIITDACTACGDCKEICPCDAIAEGKPKFIIDPDTCSDCGACISECSKNAIIEAE